MPISDRSDPALDEGAAPAGNLPSVALVPLSGSAPQERSPDASFVAQLMACARERRRVRRASPADAESAYRLRQVAPSPDGGRTGRVV